MLNHQAMTGDNVILDFNTESRGRGENNRVHRPISRTIPLFEASSDGEVSDRQSLLPETGAKCESLRYRKKSNRSGILEIENDQEHENLVEAEDDDHSEDMNERKVRFLRAVLKINFNRNSMAICSKEFIPLNTKEEQTKVRKISTLHKRIKIKTGRISTCMERYDLAKVRPNTFFFSSKEAPFTILR